MQNSTHMLQTVSVLFVRKPVTIFHHGNRTLQKMSCYHSQRSGMSKSIFLWKSCGRQLSWGLEVSSAVTMLEDRSMYCLPSVLFTEDIPK
jgi:hypothetical protein